MSTAPQAFFLPVAAGGTGQRFCLYHAHQGELRGCVVYVHPFSEEMNKSRRMAAMQSRALAQAGFSVLQIDLHGCGDSSGDFGDASWQGWIDDVLLASAWLRGRDAPHAQAPFWLWGLRAGCLLAADAAKRLTGCCNFLFWQPAASGKLVLQQFLRLKLAGDMLNASNKGLMESIRRQLDQDQSIEIAGYTLSPHLARGIEGAQLQPPDGTKPSRVEWFDIRMQSDSLTPPLATPVQTLWHAAMSQMRSHLVKGASFWHTTEIEDVPELMDATLSALLVTGGASTSLEPRT